MLDCTIYGVEVKYQSPRMTPTTLEHPLRSLQGTPAQLREEIAKLLAPGMDSLPVFRVLGLEGSADCQVVVGDVLKLAEVTVFVLGARGEQGPARSIQLQDLKARVYFQPLANLPAQPQEEGVCCRICQQEGPDLVRLTCTCQSDNGVVHEDCYRAWVMERAKVRRLKFWRTFKNETYRCEVCKEFPQNSHLQLDVLRSKVSAPQKHPYLQLHAVDSRGVQIGSGYAQWKKGYLGLTIGRHYLTSDIYLKECSVSRIAAKLFFTEEEKWVVGESTNRFGVLRWMRPGEEPFVSPGLYFIGELLVKVR